MADPGWDIPGVPRIPDSSSLIAGTSASGTSASGTSAPPISVSATPGTDSPTPGASGRARSARARSTGSVSASAGSSAGAFARSAGETAGGSSFGTAAGSTSSGFTSGPASGVPGDSARGASVPGSSLPGDSMSGASPGGGLRADGAAQALEFLSVALDYLAHADAGEGAAGSQADCLRAFAVAEARQAAAHARVLAAFSVPGGGLAGDGHGSPRVWLTWQTKATRRAAVNQVSWMKRLQAHPRVASALGDGELSVSWARQICDWSDRLPPARRDDADRTLLSAAGSGADLAGLSVLLWELVRRHGTQGSDDDGFEDRRVHLAPTFRGARRLVGDLAAPRAAP